MLEAAQVEVHLDCPMGQNRESHMRPLTTLDPDTQRAVWQEANETAPDGTLTARHVEQVVQAWRDDLPDSPTGEIVRPDPERHRSAASVALEDDMEVPVRAPLPDLTVAGLSDAEVEELRSLVEARGGTLNGLRRVNDAIHGLTVSLPGMPQRTYHADHLREVLQAFPVVPAPINGCPPPDELADLRNELARLRAERDRAEAELAALRQVLTPDLFRQIWVFLAPSMSANRADTHTEDSIAATWRDLALEFGVILQ
jgi:hypothetical protein